MVAKLNAMRLLEQHKIPYEAIPYPDDLRDAEVIAEVLGVPPHLVYKTLVAAPVEGGKPCLAILSAADSLDLKKLALVMGVKKASMLSHKEAEQTTGLKVGGISALALTHKQWPVFLDQSATEQEHILISAGQRGMDLRVPTMAFVQLVKARMGDIRSS